MNMISPVDASSAHPYRDIFDQYVDNASFLWVLRSLAVERSQYTPLDVLELEQRIQAQLDGLMTSIDLAWSVCLEALEHEDAGEVFVSTIIAFRSHDIKKIQKAVEVGLSNESTKKGLISALGWLPGELINGWVEKFFSSKDFNHKYIAVATCGVRRDNPGEFLNRILERTDCREDIPLYARSLRLIGELRRQDLMPFLNEAIASDEEPIRFWAIWSSVLLGKRELVKLCQPYVLSTGPYQDYAVNLAFRVLPVDYARTWISALAKDEKQSRIVIQATGILGDPHAVNWLIAKMQDASVAKLAGEAFSLITGIDLEASELIKEYDKDSKKQPDDGDTDLLEIDEDDGLPWPDYDKLKKFWMLNGRNFISGQRYFLGRPVSADFIKSQLNIMSQRQLMASAYELALIDSSMPLLNHQARIKG